MRPVNLIPPEDRRGERAPLRTGPLAYVIVGVLLLGFIGVYMVVTTGNSISERKVEVEGLEQQLASSSARAQALQTFSNFASLEQSRTLTVSDLARSRFDWERVLRELALVIPADVSLDTLNGSVSGSASGDAAAPESGASAEGINAPTLRMSGCGDGHESVARFVAALRDIDGVTRVGLANSTEAGAVAGESTPAPAAGDATGGGCAGDAARFEITVAFDEVQIDPASGGVLPPAEPEAAPGDGSGVAEAEQAREAGQESVDAAGQDASQAVDNYVPGT